MHKWRGFWKGPFEERSIYEYTKQEIYPDIFKEEFKKLKKAKRAALSSGKAPKVNKGYIEDDEDGG
jgi:hypothetical protein|tara:strand:- start:942 stop:1139 length:198 start_codon:yes stop_codon:yes gene_type:complete